MKSPGFKNLVLILSAVAAFCGCRNGLKEPDLTVLYSFEPSSENTTGEIISEGAGAYTPDGLLVNVPGRTVRLDRFYALAERMGRYVMVPSDDAVIRFAAIEDLHYPAGRWTREKEDFKAVLNVPEKTVKICSSPEEIVAEVPFLEGGRSYAIEITNRYQESTVTVIDGRTGRKVSVSGVHDGYGGEGRGKVQEGFKVGMHRDNYCFTLESGESVLLRKISVYSLKNDLQAMIYGASVHQPEAYYPTADFPRAWTQQMISAMDGRAVSSGRGGCNLEDMFRFMKNELPYIRTKYVIFPVNANGSVSDEKLNEIIDYIESFGAIPILDNVNCNESGTQVAASQQADRIREARGLKGCRFDLATSLAGDGLEVDKSMMYWEDYENAPAPLTGWQIYHHPNVLGSDAMFRRTLIDIPEIYELEK